MRKLILLSLFIFSSCGVEPGKNSSQFEGSVAHDFVVINCEEVGPEVCAQPPMPPCPEGQLCPMVMPVPKTYSSECAMRKDGAQFIQEGPCPNAVL